MSVVHRGRVVDNLSIPLIGAHIISLNSTPRKFAITDQDGNFGIAGEIGESFEITFIGMKPIRLTIYSNMPFKTYQMNEDATQLDEFTGTPTKPSTNNGNGAEWWRNALSQVSNVLDIARNTANTPPFQVKNTPTVTGQQNYIPSAVPSKNSNWIIDNPIAAGGILLALIAGGTYLVTGKNKSSSIGKKTGSSNVKK